MPIGIRKNKKKRGVGRGARITQKIKQANDRRYIQRRLQDVHNETGTMESGS